MGFPGGSDSKESAYNAGDPDSIPRSGRSPGEGNGYTLQSFVVIKMLAIFPVVQHILVVYLLYT